MNSNKKTALFIVIGAFIGFILGMVAALLFAATQLDAPLTNSNIRVETTPASILGIAMTDTIAVTIADVLVLTLACITIAYTLTIPKKDVFYVPEEPISIGSSSSSTPVISNKDYDYDPITPPIL
jgi:hypothetical protein